MPWAQAEPLMLDRAVAVAVAEDPGLLALSSAAASERELAVADASFPDPVVAVAAQNFPVDTFHYNQEPMTQYRVAVRQSLPRGDALSLQRERRQVRASQFEARARDRRATIVRAVSVSWLEAFRDTRVAVMLNESAPLFVELARIAESDYAVGHSSQQEVIRAQLERLHLEDREIRVQQDLERSQANLSRWIGGLAGLPLPKEPPTLSRPGLSEAEWQDRLRKHPTVALLELTVDERGLDVALAEQDYKPQFGVEVAYGARGGEDMSGHPRPDFLSVGMTFDLPLFTANRQDRRVSAARHQQSAASSERLNQIRQLQRALDDALRQREQLEARLALYRTRIVPASLQAARAALAGYRADTNDFAEVMRAHIAAVDAQIEQENLRTEIARNAVELHYLAGPEE